MNFLNKIIEGLLTQILGPVLAKTGKRWKTTLGLLVLVSIAAFHALTEGKFEGDTLATVQRISDYVEAGAWTLFGVGVTHKMLNAPPK